MSDDLNELIQAFYRQADAPRAIRAFEAWLRAPVLAVPLVHAFARMAMVSSEVRAGFEALRSLEPRVADTVLTGFDDPAFPRVSDGPPSAEELDLLWVEFFITGALAPVRRIVGVLDEPDVVRTKLIHWLRDTGTGFFGRRKLEKFRPLFVRCAIPVQIETRSIDGPLDVDLSVALAAKSGKLKFAELPVPLSRDEAVRIAAKSAALWSLKANATTHPPIAQLCGAEAVKPGGAARARLTQPD